MNALPALLAVMLTLPLSASGPVTQNPGPERQVPDARVSVLPGAGSQIGVSVRDVDPAEAARQKIQGGVVLEQVRPDSPAAAAGLRASDIIVSFDGERVRSTRQFARLVQETPPGRVVTATIVRDGKRSDVSLTPEARRSADAFFWQGGDIIIDRDALRNRIDRLPGRIDIPDFDFDLRFPGSAPRGRLGVAVDDLTPQLASYFGAKEGVLVTSVTDNTPASRGGITAGDVIVSVNGTPTPTRAELQRTVRRLTADADVAIGIVRDRKERTVTVRTESPRRTTDEPSPRTRPI